MSARRPIEWQSRNRKPQTGRVPERNADYLIVCLGEKPATEKPSDTEDLTMPRVQLDLVKALAKTGKPIILVLVEARPRIINEIEPLVDGILMAYLPGSEGGRAVADVLFGDFNPCGKLPLTYPRHTGSIWAYDHAKSDERDVTFGFDGFNPQYEFGFGLSYTDFKYDKLSLNKDTFSMGESIEISVDVSNVGELTGKEVVQLYTADSVASIVPAVRQLRKFEKIELSPGESKKINFTLTKKDLAFVNREQEWVTEAGLFKVMVGPLSSYFYLENK